jgi:tetratricopeptide (TPR) repeat protein
MTQKNVNVEAQNVEAEGLKKISWFEKNKKALIIASSVLGVLVIAFVAWWQFIVKPNQKMLLDEIAKCEVYFLKGDSTSLQKALNGDEVEALGFKYLADEYPRYQTGKLAALYAGACYYHLGQYAEAIEYLDKFEADDLHMQPGALLLKGDAYVCLKDYAKAIEAYAEVVETGNKMLAPKALMKTGIVHLELKDKAAAKTAFETIKKDFPASPEAQNIDQYISSVE